MDDRTRATIAKLIGMLGTDNEHERANAAAFLRRKLMGEGVSFGDLAELIRNGSGRVIERVVYRDREVSVPDESIELAQKIMGRAGAGPKRMGGLCYSDWCFLKDFLRHSELSGGVYRLKNWQVEALSRLEKKWCGVRERFYKAKKPGPIPQAIYDDLGLGDAPPPKAEAGPVSDAMLDDIGLGKDTGDMEDYIGRFRSTIAGEHRTRKAKPDPQTVPGGLPPEDYHGDFLDDDLTSKSGRGKGRFCDKEV